MSKLNLVLNAEMGADSENDLVSIEHVDETTAQIMLEAKLHEGVVSFMYRKADNTERKATGTLCPQYLPEHPKTKEQRDKAVQLLRQLVDSPQGDTEPWVSLAKDILVQAEPEASKKRDPGNITYYDMGVGGWRVIKAENLIAIIC